MTLATGGQSLPSDDWQWGLRGTNGAPPSRVGATAVWTGSRMLIWGGQLSGQSTWLTNGYRYQVASDTWSSMSVQHAPAARYLHTAIWTGRELIIWGGHDASRGGSVCHNTGARYDPLADIWRPMSSVGAPRPRLQHAAVWTGMEMIVWGGNNYDQRFNDGGRYDPATDTWKPLNTTGAPTARYSLRAVWTGQEMLVWGGNYLTVSGSYDFKLIYPEDLGRYDPSTDSWITNVPSGAPALRADFSAIWDGDALLVWGGYNGKTYGARTSLNNGGRFHPIANTWSLLSTNHALSGRDRHLAVWTGEEMIVWGGTDRTRAFRDGGRYNPAADSWTMGVTNGAPAGLYQGEAVWTGEAMLVYNQNLFAYHQPGRYAWDGLPNQWQRRFFGPTNSAALPDADPDRDGQNNELEYVAGTIPTNAESCLKFVIQPATVNGTRALITFSPAASGRVYSLLASPNLQPANFAPLASVFMEAGAETSAFALPDLPQSQRYFRLRIELP